MNELHKDTVKEAAIGQLRGLIGAIPSVGSYLIECLFESRSRVKQARLNRFIEGFIETMKGASLDDIDTTQFKEEEFGDFFEEILFKVSKTSSENKVTAYRNLLKHRLTSELTEYDFSNTVLELVNNLDEKQILLLNYIFNEEMYLFEREPSRMGHLKTLILYITSYSELKGAAFPFDNSTEYLMILKQQDEEGFKRLSNHFKRYNELQDYVQSCQKGLEVDLGVFIFLYRDLKSKGLLEENAEMYVEVGTDPKMQRIEILRLSNLGSRLIYYINKD